MADELKLVFPTEAYADEIGSYKQELLDNKELRHGSAGLADAETVEDWLRLVKDNQNEQTVQAGRVPASTFLCIRKSDGRMVGILDIRHRLNDFLMNYGGHIGYSVRASERRKGYAKQMLRLGFLECRKLRVDRVLLTCNKDNIASAKTILANGGVLENQVMRDGEITQRYWITL